MNDKNNEQPPMSASIPLTGALQIFKHSTAAAYLGFISGSDLSNYLDCSISGETVWIAAFFLKQATSPQLKPERQGWQRSRVSPAARLPFLHHGCVSGKHTFLWSESCLLRAIEQKHLKVFPRLYLLKIWGKMFTFYMMISNGLQISFNADLLFFAFIIVLHSFVIYGLFVME